MLCGSASRDKPLTLLSCDLGEKRCRFSRSSVTELYFNTVHAHLRVNCWCNTDNVDNDTSQFHWIRNKKRLWEAWREGSTLTASFQPLYEPWVMHVTSQYTVHKIYVSSITVSYVHNYISPELVGITKGWVGIHPLQQSNYHGVPGAYWIDEGLGKIILFLNLQHAYFHATRETCVCVSIKKGSARSDTQSFHSFKDLKIDLT